LEFKNQILTQMKKLFVVALLAGFVLNACGPKKEEAKEGGDEYSDYETAQPAEPAKASTQELIAQGEALVNASDCKTCHTVENKIVGPSYKEVAEKYDFTQANISMLAGKVLTGGAGTWGDIPMTAHPNLSQAEAEKMVVYVLSLDGEQPAD
jgi:cytochrome c